MALQHLRSSTAHKRPIPTVMSAGQIAINTNEASPGLFFKDSNGDLVKVGPVHVGENAPNSSPASVAATALVTGTVYQILTVGTSDFTLVGASANTVGTIFTATGTTTGTGTVSGQQGVEKGEMWLDTTGGTYVLKIYDGSAWRSESGTFVDVSGDTMTGALLLDNAASASAPDLSFDGDANTGIYSPGADQVAIATGGNGRVFIDSSGRVGVGTSAPNSLLELKSATADPELFRLYNAINSPTSWGIDFYRDTDPGTNKAAVEIKAVRTGGNATDLKFGTSSVANTVVERVRIDSSGRLLVGTSTSLDTGGLFQVNSNTDGIINYYEGNNATPVRLRLTKSRGATTAASDDDGLGEITFRGRDTSNNLRSAAAIAGEVDAAPGASSVAGRLVFSSTPSGSASPVERMRITSDAYVRLASGSGGIQFNGDTAAANALDDYEEGTHTTSATTSGGSVTLSSSVNELAYVKIGKLVTVHGRPVVDSVSSPTGSFLLSLPFTSADLTDSAGRSAGNINIRLVNSGYDVGLFSCYVGEGSSSLSISYGGSNDSTNAAPAMKAGTQIWVSITYTTT